MYVHMYAWLFFIVMTILLCIDWKQMRIKVKEPKSIQCYKNWNEMVHKILTRFSLTLLLLLPFIFLFPFYCLKEKRIRTKSIWKICHRNCKVDQSNREYWFTADWEHSHIRWIVKLMLKKKSRTRKNIPSIDPIDVQMKWISEAKIISAHLTKSIFLLVLH